MSSFSASVADFVKRAKEAQDAIYRDSVQDVIADAQLDRGNGGRMPVDTGYLRNTMASDLNGAGMFATDQKNEISLTLVEMGAGDIAHFAWTADYAMRQELGFVGDDSLGRTYEQGGNYFVTGAAARWAEFVAINAEKHKV